MKLLFENWNKFLMTESGLSRVLHHIENHDCAILSAYRNDPKDNSKCNPGSVDETDEEGKTLEINKRRARDLKAIFLSMDYGVTRVDGSYIENFEQSDAIEVKEDSIFVVNLNDDPEFTRNVAEMGEKFCQDSVLIIPKDEEEAYLVGTNKSEYPGYNSQESVGKLVMGKESEFMTRVKGRPFTFTEGLEVYKDLSRMEKMAIDAIKKRILK